MLNHILDIEVTGIFKITNDMFIRIFDMHTGEVRNLIRKSSIHIYRANHSRNVGVLHDTGIVLAESRGLVDNSRSTFRCHVVV